MKIILASASPRRKELLGYITKDFEVIVSNADESFVEGLTILSPVVLSNTSFAFK